MQVKRKFEIHVDRIDGRSSSFHQKTKIWSKKKQCLDHFNRLHQTIDQDSPNAQFSGTWKIKAGVKMMTCPEFGFYQHLAAYR